MVKSHGFRTAVLGIAVCGVVGGCASVAGPSASQTLLRAWHAPERRRRSPRPQRRRQCRPAGFQLCQRMVRTRARPQHRQLAGVKLAGTHRRNARPRPRRSPRRWSPRPRAITSYLCISQIEASARAVPAPTQGGSAEFCGKAGLSGAADATWIRRRSAREVPEPAGDHAAGRPHSDCPARGRVSQTTGRIPMPAL